MQVKLKYLRKIYDNMFTIFLKQMVITKLQDRSKCFPVTFQKPLEDTMPVANDTGIVQVVLSQQLIPTWGSHLNSRGFPTPVQM